MTSGPFHTDHEALNASLYHQPGRARNTELPATALNLADLAAVLSSVELGAWDRRTLRGWPTGSHPPLQWSAG